MKSVLESNSEQKKDELSISMQRFLDDMKAVDEEMEDGGHSYSEDEVRSILGLKK